MPATNDYLANDCYPKVTITSGQTESDPIDLSGTDLCGVFFPEGMVEASVKILASDVSGRDYREVLKDESSGQAYSISVAANKYVPVTNLAVVAGLRHIKLVANSAVAANRVLTLATRPV